MVPRLLIDLFRVDHWIVQHLYKFIDRESVIFESLAHTGNFREQPQVNQTVSAEEKCDTWFS